MIKATKESVRDPKLGDIVFHETIYRGKVAMEIVGIRKDSVELQGDYSGGTHNTISASWYPLVGTFRLVKLCDEIAKHGACKLHNLWCRFPDCNQEIHNWGHYVDGKLVDEVVLTDSKGTIIPHDEHTMDKWINSKPK